MLKVDQFLRQDLAKAIVEYKCAFELSKEATALLIRENDFEKSIQYTEDLLKSLKALQKMKEKREMLERIHKVAVELQQQNVDIKTIVLKKAGI
ncbi:YqaH family protein [Weizmannia coagulans]|jgi:hypothetical protein|uniref:Uncharacterized protein n=3 Tax=Heyndrickxia TaxID=2837504 RepID=A0A0C5C872_HEYCO|nr:MULTISPECIES: YqaH family protein [Heyndrickxia]AJO22859.1 hypothetical protein SB48_HM08orf03280 [Heyndrickxia coagulans]AKN55629.1 hypothetical protein AB434_3224 [Heyndrickxia coagulans]ATW83100.1 hypothetical protein CIW84_08970 [Heyndrickxia coagulans]AVD56236.1 hypothetical protein C3766_08860 [Heyndrickxia coagulans]KXT22083.1 hypothetical protein UZ35_00525 [Heyndrickxia coagulans]